MQLTNIVGGAAAAILVSQPAAAELIDVQFAGYSAQSGAAVIGAAGDVWNLFGQAAPGTFQGLQYNPSASLVTAANKTSNYTLFYYSPSAYTVNADYDKFTGTSDANLMSGYLYTFTYLYAQISGLSPGEPFSLYLYTQGDDNTAGRVNNLTVNGVSQTDINTNASTFILNDNYALFQGVATATGTVQILDVVSTTEADLNGFQLLTASVAEPATWATMLIGFAGLGAAVRVRRRDRHIGVA